jgi:hypothetical protein
VLICVCKWHSAHKLIKHKGDDVKALVLLVMVWAALVGVTYACVNREPGITPATFDMKELCVGGAFKPLCGDVVVNTGTQL